MGSFGARLELPGSNFTGHMPSVPLKGLLRLIPARRDELPLRLAGLDTDATRTREFEPLRSPPHEKRPNQRALSYVARPERFELPTPRFEAWCSIQLSYGRRREA